MTLIERLARKLFANFEPRCAAPDAVSLTQQAAWKSYVPIARKLLADLREPTDAMLAAVPVDHYGDLDAIWRAMIDAAMKEEP